MDRLKGD